MMLVKVKEVVKVVSNVYEEEAEDGEGQGEAE